MSNDTVTVTELQYIDPRAGSDKFYRTYVIGHPDGTATMRTQYGRNGATGTFTKPADHPDTGKASAAAAKKATAKVAKGYQPVGAVEVTLEGRADEEALAAVEVHGENVTPVEVEQPDVEPVALAGPQVGDATSDVVSRLGLLDHPARPVTTEDTLPSLPTRPMLAEVADPAAVEAMLADPAWVTQLKYDGDRVLVEVTDGAVRVLNRQGKAKVRNLPPTSVLNTFTALSEGRWVFDGEVVGDTLVLFDLLLASDGQVTIIDDASPFSRRNETLGVLVDTLGLQKDAALVATVAASTREKRAMLAEAADGKREGVMFRRAEAPYRQGRRSLDLLKHKFDHDADVVVTALHPAKESATLSVTGPDGAIVEVGSASTIGKGGVAVGDVWTAAFLYVINPDLPRLVQPRLVTRRHDKSAEECLTSQFEHAGTDKSV